MAAQVIPPLLSIFVDSSDGTRLPDNITYAEGALLEPLSVVMRGIQVARLHLGRGVVVCGAGPIGLIALAAARASGAHPIVVTDLDANRLAFAKEFAPTCIPYQMDPKLDAEGNAAAIRALFGKEEYSAPETVLECTGVEPSICTAAYTARRGGNMVVIGVGKSIMNNLPFMHLSLAEVGPVMPFIEIVTLMIDRLTCVSSIAIATPGRRRLPV